MASAPPDGAPGAQAIVPQRNNQGIMAGGATAALPRMRRVLCTSNVSGEFMFMVEEQATIYHMRGTS